MVVAPELEAGRVRIASVEPVVHGAGLGRPFPRAVLGRLGVARRGLLAHARGAVLDLDGDTALHEVEMAARAAAAGDPAPTGPYDTVLGVAVLVDFADLYRAMSGIAALLAEEGELWLVEPASRPGAVSLVLSTLWSYHPSVAGLHLERDLPATVRSVGLTITDLEMLTMPTAVRPLRSFLRLRARRFPDFVPVAGDGEGRR